MHRAHEYADIARICRGCLQTLTGVARIFERRPCHFKHQPLLWVQKFGFPWRNTEEQRVELVRVGDESTPTCVATILASGIDMLVPVPPIGRHLRDRTAA